MFVHSSQCVKLLSTKCADSAAEITRFGLVDFDGSKIPLSSVHTLGDPLDHTCATIEKFYLCIQEAFGWYIETKVSFGSQVKCGKS